jgi:hypothetical protein
MLLLLFDVWTLLGSDITSAGSFFFKISFGTSGVKPSGMGKHIVLLFPLIFQVGLGTCCLVWRQSKAVSIWISRLFKLWLWLGGIVMAVAIGMTMLWLNFLEGGIIIGFGLLLGGWYWIQFAPVFLCWWAYAPTKRTQTIPNATMIHTDSICMTPTTIQFPNTTYEFTVQAIERLRFARPAGTEIRPCMMFDAFGRTFACGAHLETAQVRWLFHAVQTILAWRCYQVEAVVFGNRLPRGMSPNHTLLNPDLVDVTVPLWRLTTIVIVTQTYDMLLVERFLTYAVNTLGQAYLNKHVETRFYGNPENLHPHIMNSVTNLCQAVHVDNIEE